MHLRLLGLTITGAWSIALTSVSLLPLSSLPAHADADALWRIVNQECVPEQLTHADQSHCAGVNIADGPDRGFAVLKDNASSKPYDFLLIPTRRITGIEDLAVLEPKTPNYFAAAWSARRFVATRLGQPLQWDDVILAVNSRPDRSQNQLHIHIGCLRPDVKAALQAEDLPAGSWGKLDLPAPDHSYDVRWLSEQDFDSASPFMRVADELPGTRQRMDFETIDVIGGIRGDGTQGFYLVASAVTAQARAHGEDLIDPTCRGAKTEPPRP